MSDYKTISKEARLQVLEMIYLAQTSHIGSNFSCIDIMTVLFDKIDLTKDKFVLSAGWKAAALYYFLYRAGKITKPELDTYCQANSKFIGLAEPVIPEIPFSGGSMGLGFPAAVGFALAKKLAKEEGKVFCLMSDGEMQIGTTWEGMLIAKQHKLDNLIVIVDCNGLQAMGPTEDILKTYIPFGASRMDGHNFTDIGRMLNEKMRSHNGVPHIIEAVTVKGKGVSFMENNNLFHYKAPSTEEYEKAKGELKHV